MGNFVRSLWRSADASARLFPVNSLAVSPPTHLVFFPSPAMTFSLAAFAALSSLGDTEFPVPFEPHGNPTVVWH